MRRPRTKSHLILTLAALSLLVVCCRPSADGESAPGRNRGSYTLTHVAQAWAEAYGEAEVGFAFPGSSSAAAIAALIDGTENLVFASRRLNDREKELARGNSIELVEHVVGLDALAVYLHHDNPAESLSIPQLAEIYGEGGTTETWDQVMEYAIPGCDSDQIMRFSRRNDSDAYVDFMAVVLGKQRDARGGARAIDDPRDLVERVKKTPCAIGYSSMAHAVEHVKLACIAAQDGGAEEAGDEATDSEATSDCVFPSAATTADRSYPIVRPIVMITRGEPQGAIKAYLDWVLSDAGQCILRDEGYVPVKTIACQ